MNKDKIKQELNELKYKIIEIENKLKGEENFIPCTKEELFQKATCGLFGDDTICGWKISEVNINNNLDHYCVRGMCSIDVVLHRAASAGEDALQAIGRWIGGPTPGVILDSTYRCGGAYL